MPVLAHTGQARTLCAYQKVISMSKQWAGPATLAAAEACSFPMMQVVGFQVEGFPNLPNTPNGMLVQPFFLHRGSCSGYMVRATRTMRSSVQMMKMFETGINNRSVWQKTLGDQHSTK